MRAINQITKHVERVYAYIFELIEFQSNRIISNTNLYSSEQTVGIESGYRGRN